MQALPPSATPQVVAWDPGEDDDVMSTRASKCHFQACKCAFSPREDPSPELSFQGADPASVEAEDGPETSPQRLWEHRLGKGSCPLRATQRAALAKVRLDHLPATHLMSNPFFRQTPLAPTF